VRFAPDDALLPPDYWTRGELYAKLPVWGRLMRFLARKMVDAGKNGRLEKKGTFRILQQGRIEPSLFF